MKTPFRAPLWVVLFVLPLLAGMGSIFGEEPADKIPAPERKFEAVFLDQTDVATACTSVSIQGNTFIEGKRGEGTYTVPFDKVREIEFLMKGSELRGIVRLKNGDPVELVLNGDHRAYGKTAYGTFQIRLGDLKRMSFPGGETAG